jgi:hypothetical protein
MYENVRHIFVPNMIFLIIYRNYKLLYMYYRESHAYHTGMLLVYIRCDAKEGKLYE